MEGEPTLIASMPRPGRAHDAAVRRVALAPVTRLTRAHLALQRRPLLGAEARAGLEAVAARLCAELGAPVALEARLAEGSLAAVAQLQGTGPLAVLELDGAALAVLELDPATAGALLARAAGTEAGAFAPLTLTRVEEAALGWLLLTSLAAVRGVRGAWERWAPRLVAVSQDRRAVLAQLQAERRHLAVQVAVRVGEEGGLARLLLPAGWVLAAAARHPEPPPGPLAPEVAEARIALEPRLGPAALSRAEARALGVGDVVILPGALAGGSALHGPGRLLGSGFEARGDFGPAGFTLLRARERLPPEPPMRDDDPAIPLELEVELARLRLPLAALGSLQPGMILPLHLDAAQTVLLRVGDRALARAELVEVEGSIGARILQLLGRAP
jgi:type III secretion protein Q